MHLERLSRSNLHIKPLTPISAMYLPQTPGSLPKPRSLENPDRFLPAQSSFIFIYNSSGTWAFAASVTHTHRLCFPFLSNPTLDFSNRKRYLRYAPRAGFASSAVPPPRAWACCSCTILCGVGYLGMVWYSRYAARIGVYVQHVYL